MTFHSDGWPCSSSCQNSSENSSPFSPRTMNSFFSCSSFVTVLLSWSSMSFFGFWYNNRSIGFCFVIGYRCEPDGDPCRKYRGWWCNVVVVVLEVKDCVRQGDNARKRPRLIQAVLVQYIIIMIRRIEKNQWTIPLHRMMTWLFSKAIVIASCHCATSKQRCCELPQPSKEIWCAWKREINRNISHGPTISRT